MKNERTLNTITRPLYEEDAYLSVFEGKVLTCKAAEIHKEGKTISCYGISLDATAFFPEGGGQEADRGLLNGQEVLDVKKEDGAVFHYVKEPIPEGSVVKGEVDFEIRFRRMQNHSGEHLFCGLIHSLYGFENVGFHMGADGVTVDVNGALTEEDFDRLEALANRGVAENVAIYAVFPDTPDEMEYRSKIELEEDVRVVIIEGYDACACCAPHVKTTGEIGVIKVIDFMSHRGGTRFTLKCGLDAYGDYCLLHKQIGKSMRILSAKRDACDEALERLSRQMKEQHETILRLKKEITSFYVNGLHEDARNGNLPEYKIVFAADLDEVQMRTLVNEGVTLFTGIVGVFMGSDEAGYRYILGKNASNAEMDLKAFTVAMNQQLSGRGGGSPVMVQGSVSAVRKEIEAFFTE